MSLIEKNVCEYCGATTDDWYRTKGWIHLDSIGLFISDGTNIRRHTDLIGTSNEDYEADFCHYKHMIGWLFLSEQTDNRSNEETETSREELLCLKDKEEYNG